MTRAISFSLAVSLAPLLFIMGCTRRAEQKPTPEAAQQLLKLRGYEFDQKSFFTAVGAGDLMAVNSFLAAGMSPDTQDEKGLTALMLSVSRGETEILKALLKAGADVNRKDNEGGCALTYAAQVMRSPVVQTLLEHPRVDVNAQTDRGSSVLAIYVAHEREDVVPLLLQRGANTDLQDRDGDTPVHAAALKRNPRLMQMILEKGTNPNLRNRMGGTPLMWAAAYGNLETSRLLLEQGADPTIKDEDGLTAADWAVKNKQVELARLMTQAVKQSKRQER